MTVRVVVPGSFDPIHNGHVDIVERAADRFDHVTVAVLVNPAKDGLFTIEERTDLIRQVTSHCGNVEVDSFTGLLIDYCNDRGIGLICKGLRAASDFDFELQMAQMNSHIGATETVFMTTRPEWSFLSSSLVKEVARWGGDVADTVPEVVARALAARVERP